MSQAANRLRAERVGADGWRRVLAEAVRDANELMELLELDRSEVDTDLDPEFPLLVPRSFVARMGKRDPRDPLLLQVLPTQAERESAPNFLSDPVAELDRSLDGVIEKYAQRALLVTTGACPVHCRYCFRREYPYARQNAARGGWRPAVDRLQQNPLTHEVILSGGDPLSLSTHKLGELIGHLEAVPQLRTLRIHTRFPVMIPERIDKELLDLFASTSLQVVVVIHANHANEIDGSVAAALERLKRNTAGLLNQSVLLRGVNDHAEALVRLSERLFACSVLPYYLHLLDPVRGAAHFDVSADEALSLGRELRHQLPGYLVPRLVREIPGALSKTWMG